MNPPININDLLKGTTVEWERLEFKKGWNPENILHSICAFANDFHNLGGGYIIVGIEEKDGQPILPPFGVKPSTIDDIQKELLGLGNNALMPSYHPILFPVEFQEKMILVIWVPGGMTRPYKAKVTLGKGSEYKYYIRKNSSSVVAKGTDETELLSLAATVPFDDRYNQRATIKDLDKGLIKEFLQDIKSSLADEVDSLSIEEIGRAMHIVDGPKEAFFPLNIALMMFNPKPYEFFPYTQIDIVWFGKEGAGGDKFSEKIFKGPIHKMTKEALDFIDRNFITETVIKYPDRAEADRVKNYPFAAIEEAVVNAVYHRSYEIREPIEIRIYQDEIIILSYPGPDRSVKLESFEKGRVNSRRYRNRRIGEFFKDLKMTEGRSTGIKKIIDAMAENGSPKPHFEFDEEHTYFQVTLPIHEASQKKGIENILTLQAGTKLGLSEDQVQILRESVEPRAIKELMELSKRTNRTKYRDQVLNPLLEKGYLEPTIPDKPTSSKQKYRLTELGKSVLANLEM